MDKIHIANILLTRKCNLKCSYCHIVKNYKDMPKQYPEMKHYYKNEISPEEWIKILTLLKKNNPNVFCIFYGGEPFLYKGLDKIISYCHDKDIYYTIISNNTEEIKPIIEELVLKVGKLKGFTASVDPILFSGQTAGDIFYKSKAGFESLVQYKRDGLAEDVVAEITITPETFEFLYKTVKGLSEAGIYSSITAIDDKKSPYYDFSGVEWNQPLLKPTEYVKMSFDAIINDKSLLVHSPEVLNDLYKCLPSKYFCKIFEDVHNVTIDADGTFRLCLRIRGVKTPSYSYNLMLDKNGKVTNLFKEQLGIDYHHYCRNCNWTCMMFTKNYVDKIITH